jgi:hypothetical protein
MIQFGLTDIEDIRRCFHEDFYLPYRANSVLNVWLTREEIEFMNNRAFEIRCEMNEKANYEKAEKLIPEEWGDSPIFYGDTYYDDIEYFLEDEEHEDVEYFWGSIERKTLTEDDLYYAIQNIDENLNIEDWEGHDVPDYLVDAWKKYVEEYGESYYDKDNSIAIILKTRV